MLQMLQSMLRKIMSFILALFTFYVILMMPQGLANNAKGIPLSLTLQNANLPDAIRLIAKFINRNVIVSPAVSGMATLHLQDADPLVAFTMLLSAHHLALWELRNIWLIAPQDELIKQKVEERKWQEINEETAPLITDIWQVKYARAEDIAHLLSDEHTSFLSKRARVSVDERTNIICIQDLADRVRNVHRIMQYLDVPVLQVLIKARLASVDHDFERTLGIEFDGKLKPSKNREWSERESVQQEVSRYSLAIFKLADGALLDVKLSALENEGHAELISSPSLFTANQQSASIEAGEEVPYQEASESGGTTVVFKKAVLGLKVTPHVLPGNNVLLQLQINQDRPSDNMVLGMPTISTRQMMTSVLVKNGQTIVLGGIYETNAEKGQRRVPFLSKLPVLGLLFKQETIRNNKRELLVFVTPTIMR